MVRSVITCVDSGNEYLCFAYVFVENRYGDYDFVCFFVEDAEEDAETIAFLWKTLIGRKKIRQDIFF